MFSEYCSSNPKSAPSFGDYYKSQYTYARNKTFLKKIDPRINAFAFNLCVYEGSLRAEANANKKLDFGVKSGVNVVSSNIGASIGSRLVGAFIDTVSSVVGTQINVAPDLIKTAADYTIKDPLKQMVQQPLQDFVAEPLQQIAESAVENVKNSPNIHKIYNPFGEISATEFEKTEAFEELQRQIEEEIQGDLLERKVVHYSINPFKVGPFRCIRNIICAIVFPILRLLAKICGGIKGEEVAATCGDEQLFQESLKAYCERRNIKWTTIEQMSNRLNMDSVSKKRFHSPLTTGLRATYYAANKASQAATAVSNFASNALSSMWNSFTVAATA